MSDMTRLARAGWATVAGCVVCSCIVFTTGPVAAQDAYLASIYGDGVHQYFRNDIGTARARFDAVIGQGSRDPRAYYFRAILCWMQAIPPPPNRIFEWELVSSWKVAERMTCGARSIGCRGRTV